MICAPGAGADHINETAQLLANSRRAAAICDTRSLLKVNNATCEVASASASGLRASGAVATEQSNTARARRPMSSSGATSPDLAMGLVNITPYVPRIWRKGFCWQIRCVDGRRGVCCQSERFQSEISEIAIQALAN